MAELRPAPSASALTHTPRSLRELADHHGVVPRRSLGQHFVADPNTVRRIASLANLAAGDPVVEVGAGLGSLTLALAETGARIVAIETDGKLAAVLRQLVDAAAPPGQIAVVEADALRIDWTELLADADSWVLVANLPYNVATPLLLDLLDDVPAVRRMLVMVQREAGERLVAGPGTAAFGVPSLKVAYWATARVVGRVGPNVFWPRPKVESVLVEVRRRPQPAVDADPAVLFALIRSGFQQRRKKIRTSLRPHLTPEEIDRAGVSSDARPGELGLEDWARLADAVGAGS